MGKGEVRNEIAAHIIKEHEAKVFMASFEEVNKGTYKRLAGKLASRIFHDPKIPFDYEAYDKVQPLLADRLAMVDIYQNANWSSLKQDFMEAAEWGAKLFCIDPITNFTDHLSAAQANEELQMIAHDCSVMAMDFDVHIMLFCHLKSPEGNISQEARQAKYAKGHYIGLGNCPHGLGGDVVTDQFAGSRAMMRKCNVMLGLQGNKDPELDINIRNIREIKICEEREFGATGKFPVYWDYKTGRFTEL